MNTSPLMAAKQTEPVGHAVFPTKEEISALASKGDPATIISRMEPFLNKHYMTDPNRESFEHLLNAYHSMNESITFREPQQKKISELKQWLYETASTEDQYFILFSKSFAFEEPNRRGDTIRAIASQKMYELGNYRTYTEKMRVFFKPPYICTENRDIFKELFLSYFQLSAKIKSDKRQIHEKLKALRRWLVETSPDGDEKADLLQKVFHFEQRPDLSNSDYKPLPSIEELDSFLMNQPEKVIEKMEPFLKEEYLQVPNRKHFSTLLFAYVRARLSLDYDAKQQEGILRLKKWLFSTDQTVDDFKFSFRSDCGFEKGIRKEMIVPDKEVLQGLFDQGEFMQVFAQMMPLLTPDYLTLENLEQFTLLLDSCHQEPTLPQNSIDQNKILALRQWLYLTNDGDYDEMDRIQRIRFPFDEKRKPSNYI